ncbi:MAG: ChbG/HpnK family deacetylase [Bacillota bacterium]
MKIIVNADDFGLNESCTNAILQAFQENLITDTTIVANGEAFDLAISYIKQYHLENKIGIHLNLTEGTPLTKNILKHKSFVEDGVFHGRIKRFRFASKAEKLAVHEELTAQVSRVLEQGIKLSHADSHHHIHVAPIVSRTVLQVCKEFDINKIRIHRNIGEIGFIKKLWKKAFNLWLKYKRMKTADYMGSLNDLQLIDNGKDSIYEIMVHPEYNRNKDLIDTTDKIGEYCYGARLNSVQNIKSQYVKIGYDEV